MNTPLPLPPETAVETNETLSVLQFFLGHHFLVSSWSRQSSSFFTTQEQKQKQNRLRAASQIVFSARNTIVF